jgi:hypothetical protein
MATNALKMLGHGKTMFFLCDMQTRFREDESPSDFRETPISFLTTGSAIYGFDHVANTASKMLKIAKVRRPSSASVI